MVATTFGDAGAKAVEYFKGMKVVVVTHVTGRKGPDTQELTDENRKKIVSKGGILITAAHAFTGTEGAIRKKWDVHLYNDIIANTLYVLGQGVKVCIEVALMAADAGAVLTTENIVSISGTNHGADTALVMKPVPSSDFFNLRVAEILCKPYISTGSRPVPQPGA